MCLCMYETEAESVRKELGWFSRFIKRGRMKRNARKMHFDSMGEVEWEYI